MPAKDAMDQDNSALLSDATLSTLHLQHQPFTAQLQDSLKQDDEAVLPFSDDVTEEQLADIKQALITGDDLLLVLGELGAGKSTLLKQLDANSGLRIQCFPVAANERFKTLTLFSGMLEAFHQAPPANLKDVLDELIPHLQSMVARNTLCTIVLDDAHMARKEELTQLLSGMLYMNSQDETLMRITLAATEEFEDTIPELLPEGADLPYSSLTVEGLSAPRAAAYIDYRLQLAGFDQEFPFTERDMDSLVEHSAGRPGQLNLLTADVLNEKYGRIDNELPNELLSTQPIGFMQSRFGKLALGAVATLLIVGGLLMFRADDNPSRSEPGTSVIAQSPENTVEVPDLQVIDSQTISNATEANAIQDAASNATDAANNVVQDTTDAIADAASDVASLPPLDSESRPPTVIVAEDTTIINSPVEATDNVNEAVDSSVDNAIAQTPDAPVADDSAVSANDDTAAEDAANAVAEAEALEAQAALRELNEQITEPEVAQEPAEQATPANTPEPIDSTLAGVLESPTWILVQDDERYTIQLSASRDLDSIQDFLRRNPLPGPNSIFSFERAGEVWYALVHGSFEGVSQAQQAVERMPDSAQRDQPWIRSIARVKAVLLQP